MKRTISAATLALLTLTGCGGSATSQLAPADDYELRAVFQWVPETPDTQPTAARFVITPSDPQYAYSTEIADYDVLESSYQREHGYEHMAIVPPGGSMTVRGEAMDPPVDGKVTCAIVEVAQQVVLDYQESAAPTDPVTCHGFTDDDHDYTPGELPEGREFDFDDLLPSPAR